MKHILFFHFRNFLRQKETMIWVILMPLLFAWFFSAVHKDGSGRIFKPGTVQINNLDAGPVGQALVDDLAGIGYTVVTEPSDRSVAVLTIPEGYSDKVAAGESVDVSVVFDADVSSSRTMQLRVHLFQFTVRLVKSLFYLDRERLPMAEFASIFHRPSGITLAQATGERKKKPAGSAQSFPAILVMFMLMNILIYGGVMLKMDLDTGVTKRLLVSPVSKVGFLSALVLFRGLVGMFQAVILLAVGYFFFDVPYLVSAPWLLVILLIFSLAVGALSMVLAVVMGNPERISTAAILFTLPLAAMGGCWWPLEVMPKGWQAFAWYLPTGNIMDVFNRSFIGETTFAAISGNLAYFGVLGVVLTIIAVVMLNRRMLR